MHYIRFLKSPTASKTTPRALDIQFSAKITITSDLGESFLCTDLLLMAVLRDSRDRHIVSQGFHWIAGSRQQEINIKWPARGITGWPCYMYVITQDKVILESLSDIIDSQDEKNEYQGGVLKAKSDAIQPPGEPIRGPKRLLRTLRFNETRSEALDVFEETGESIARHVWDAGLVLSAILQKESEIINSKIIRDEEDHKPKFSQSATTPLPRLLHILSKPHLRVLELGSGCGIVGITFSHCFHDSNITLTDLPEAEEIARCNIARCVSRVEKAQKRKPNLSYQNLDWADPFPEGLLAEPIDLVLVADCTYNPDVVPDLVSTLGSIVHSDKNVTAGDGSGTLILLAMKVRHESERVFFDLMEQNRMSVVDKMVQQLLHRGEEDQEIEIYLFSGR